MASARRLGVTRDEGLSKYLHRPRTVDPNRQLCIYPTEDFEQVSLGTLQRKFELEEMNGSKSEKTSENSTAVETKDIPTPEFYEIVDEPAGYDKEFVVPEGLITQSVLQQAELFDYDMDSSDEEWLEKNKDSLNLTSLQFERRIEELERGSRERIMSIDEVRELWDDDNPTVMAVYDYWLEKRTRLGWSSLLLEVPTDETRPDDPYTVFRRRSEKVVTRKGRKDTEQDYMLALRSRENVAKLLQLLAMCKEREELKREGVQLSKDIFEARIRKIRESENSANGDNNQSSEDISSEMQEMNLAVTSLQRRRRQMQYDYENPYEFEPKPNCTYFPAKPIILQGIQPDEKNVHEVPIYPQTASLRNVKFFDNQQHPVYNYAYDICDVTDNDGGTQTVSTANKQSTRGKRSFEETTSHSTFRVSEDPPFHLVLFDGTDALPSEALVLECELSSPDKI